MTAQRIHQARWRTVEAGALLRLCTGSDETLTFSWAEPSSGVWAVGLGQCDEGGAATVQWENGAPPGMPGPWFGGWSFSGEERWVLPRVLAWWAGGKTHAAWFGDGAEEALSEVEPVTHAVGARRVARAEARAEWERRVGAALEQIEAGRMSKVVLARTIEVERVAIGERALLKVLEARFPSCRTFLFRQPDGSAFVGATPERLARVAGNTLETEAVAGTAAPGQGAALLKSEKDLREHRAVIDGIRSALEPIADGVVSVAAPSLRTLPNVVHLVTPVRAQLKTGALEAARALHPTPATCGTPRPIAKAWLAANEGLDRGWYCGAIGWRSESGVDLAVGLRSAVLRGDRATLFVGAGIVSGSTPAAEWDETERKALALLGALGVEP